VKYLQENNTCPKCENLIHVSYPLNYISHDRTMQDLVYKLVPNLQECERKRQVDFYKKKGLPLPEGISLVEEKTDTKKESPKEDTENKDCHRHDEQVNISLECVNMKMLKRRYLRCSTYATINHIKKYIAMKLFSNMEKYKNVDILCNEEILGKDHTLKFVCVTRWRHKDIPLKLQYRQKVQL